MEVFFNPNCLRATSFSLSFYFITDIFNNTVSLAFLPQVNFRKYQKRTLNGVFQNCHLMWTLLKMRFSVMVLVFCKKSTRTKSRTKIVSDLLYLRLRFDFEHLFTCLRVWTEGQTVQKTSSVSNKINENIHHTALFQIHAGRRRINATLRKHRAY